MALRLKIVQPWKNYIVGNTYAFEDAIGVPLINDGVAVYSSDPVSGSSTADMSVVLVDESGNILNPSGIPAKLTATLTRPADVLDYAANDSISFAAANVKQKDTVTLTGTNGDATIVCAGVTKIATFDTDLTTTAANFVTANAAAYLAAGVVLTSSVADLIFEANVAGVPFTAPTIENTSYDLGGTIALVNDNVVAVKQKDTLTLTGTSGTATVSAEGVDKLATFNTDLTTTASDFVTAWAADYLAVGVVLTSSGADLIFEANVAGTPFVSPTIVNVTTDLDGTVVNTTANAVAEKKLVTITITGTEGYATIASAGSLTKILTFDTDLTTTAANFVTSHAAAYLVAGIVVTSAGAVLSFEANVAGTTFTTPTILVSDLDGTVANTTANVILVPMTISNACIATGGGGIIKDIRIETDATQFAGKTVRAWLFSATPSNIPGDNVTYTNLFADTDKVVNYFDVTFDALLGASDCVIGKTSTDVEYVCTGTSLYLLFQTISAVTAPASEGVFNFYFNVLKIA